MGIRTNNNIIIKKNNRNINIDVNIIEIENNTLTKNDIIRKRVEDFPPIDFTAPPTKTRRRDIEERLRSIFQGKIFSKQDWKNGMMLNILQDPKVSKYVDSSWYGEIDFELYPRGKKQKGIVKGNLGFESVMARKYPKSVHYFINELVFDDAKKESKKVSSKLGKDEEKGWKNILESNNRIDISSYFPKIHVKSGDIRKNLINYLAAEQFKTNGEEILKDGSITKTYTSIKDINGKAEGYTYLWRIPLYRAYHKKEMAANFYIEQKVFFNQKPILFQFTLVKAEKY